MVGTHVNRSAAQHATAAGTTDPIASYDAERHALGHYTLVDYLGNLVELPAEDFEGHYMPRDEYDGEVLPPVFQAVEDKAKGKKRR